jgi:hypothetical protein
VSLGRNEPCHCGNGEKYKRCHLDLDRDAQRALHGALPILQDKMRHSREYDRILRDEYGVYINYVSPIPWQGRKVWAIGSRLYTNRRPNETYHEFILDVLRSTLGEEWRATQAALPDADQHFVFRCFEQLRAFKAAHADPDKLARRGQFSADMNGWVRYLLSLAWDIATLIHAGEPPPEMIDRLRDHAQYQGARYEIAIAAIFARLDCSIRWLDADPALQKAKHVEFEAQHRPTGQTVAVEAKSRHRSGVLNQPGQVDANAPLRKDQQMVRRLFNKAVEKAPENMPYFVFVDINAPSDTQAQWQAGVRHWMDRMPAPTTDQPAEYNATYFTNFSPHYDGDDLSAGVNWLGVWPVYTRNRLEHDFQPILMAALNAYGRVPPFAEDQTLLD